MYDLVYLVEQSRISEKMLEKAFLLSMGESKIKEMFQLDGFIYTNDESMLSQLEKMGNDVVDLLAPENPRKLYLTKLERELNEKNYKMTPDFLANLEEDPDELAEKLTLKLAEELKIEKYLAICDIIKARLLVRYT